MAAGIFPMQGSSSSGSASGVAAAARQPKSFTGWCPVQKRVPTTDWIVDGFPFRLNTTFQTYFLTHFHSDHYGGLTRSFSRGRIYCSAVTAKLLERQMGIQPDLITPLPMRQAVPIAADSSPASAGSRMIHVTLLDANHCPGSTMILFELPPAGIKVLHTGDFRGDPSHRLYLDVRQRLPIHDLYLDTTYASPRYAFPPQKEVLETVATAVSKEIAGKNKCLVLVGAYSIGKERMALAIAQRLQSKIHVDRRRMHMLECCLQDETLSAMTADSCHSQRASLSDCFSSSPARAQDCTVHMVSLFGGGMKFSRFEEYASSLDSPVAFDCIVGIEPTGWTFSKKMAAGGAMFTRTEKGRCVLLRVPYSEHSSFQELRTFVQSVAPQRIVPTVNVGTSSRKLLNILALFEDLCPLPAVPGGPSSPGQSHPLLESLLRRESYHAQGRPLLSHNAKAKEPREERQERQRKTGQETEQTGLSVAKIAQRATRSIFDYFRRAEKVAPPHNSSDNQGYSDDDDDDGDVDDDDDDEKGGNDCGGLSSDEEVIFEFSFGRNQLQMQQQQPQPQQSLSKNEIVYLDSDSGTGSDREKKVSHAGIQAERSPEKRRKIMPALGKEGMATAATLHQEKRQQPQLQSSKNTPSMRITSFFPVLLTATTTTTSRSPAENHRSSTTTTTTTTTPSSSSS